MNLVCFKTFLIVCELGNFTEAAKYLYVPQPTISNRMKSLEQDLGQELFMKGSRGKRTAQLTEAGETFYPYAKQIIESIDIVKEKINTSSRQTLLKVGSSVPPTHPLIFYYLKEIEHLRNFISIDVIDKNSEVMNLLTDKSLDLAFVSTPIADKDLECQEINSDEIELIVSPHHPLASMDIIDNLAALENKQVVMYTPFNKHLEQSNLVSIKYQRQLTTNSFDFIQKLILYHNWISFMPSQMINNEIERGYLVNIPIHHNLLIDLIRYYIVYRKNEVNEKLYHTIFQTDFLTSQYLETYTCGEVMQ